MVIFYGDFLKSVFKSVIFYLDIVGYTVMRGTLQGGRYKMVYNPP